MTGKPTNWTGNSKIGSLDWASAGCGKSASRTVSNSRTAADAADEANHSFICILHTAGSLRLAGRFFCRLFVFCVECFFLSLLCCAVFARSVHRCSCLAIFGCYCCCCACLRWFEGFECDGCVQEYFTNTMYGNVCTNMAEMKFKTNERYTLHNLRAVLMMVQHTLWLTLVINLLIKI